jgi:hypothetical protein
VCTVCVRPSFVGLWVLGDVASRVQSSLGFGVWVFVSVFWGFVVLSWVCRFGGGVGGGQRERGMREERGERRLPYIDDRVSSRLPHPTLHSFAFDSRRLRVRWPDSCFCFLFPLSDLVQGGSKDTGNSRRAPRKCVGRLGNSLLLGVVRVRPRGRHTPSAFRTRQTPFIERFARWSWFDRDCVASSLQLS